MRKRILIGALLFVAARTAGATDCTSWRKIDDDVKRERIEAIISHHMNSNVSKRYTSEHRVAMQSCLQGFVGQIVAEFDATCSDRPGANAEVLDDVFDRFLLSCVQ
jgi:hypothetical protein